MSLPVPVALESGPVPNNQGDPWNEKTTIAFDITPQQLYSSNDSSENVTFDTAVVDIGASETSRFQSKLAYEPKFELETRAIDEFRPLKVCCLAPVHPKCID